MPAKATSSRKTAKDSDYRALAAFRYHIGRYLEFSDQAAKAAGIEPRQYQLLLAIRGLPETIEPTVGALAHQLRSRHHSTVELINRGETNGLVERSRADACPGAIDQKRPTHFRTSCRETLAGASGGRTGSREHASTIDKYQPYLHKETEMRKRYWHRLAYLSFLIAVFCIAGCKKHVAA